MIEFAKVQAEDIKNNLVHLKQIVFEVTDACNLRCKYCAYADLYEGYDKRENLCLDFRKAKIIIDYMHKLWKENENIGVVEPISIGFYGGEPLININLIKEIVSYIENLPFVGKKFYFNMTTNAMLLDHYMDYLAEKKFHLLISLDGDRKGQGFRVDINGCNSFDQVFKNVQLLFSKYPEYFKSFVSFNSVLHKLNSVEEIYQFIENNFNKKPIISQLNTSGIRKEKLEDFNKIFRNYSDSIKEAKDIKTLSDKLFIKNPETHFLLDYIHFQTGNVYSTFNELFVKIDKGNIFPTGTCSPFQKKMYITVNGKILQCEKIDHKYALGKISDIDIQFDFEKIAQRHNEYIFKFINNCKQCGLIKRCVQCVYEIDNLDKDELVCSEFCHKEKEKQRIQEGLEYLNEHPQLYCQILRNVVIRG